MNQALRDRLGAAFVAVVDSAYDHAHRSLLWHIAIGGYLAAEIASTERFCVNGLTEWRAARAALQALWMLGDIRALAILQETPSR